MLPADYHIHTLASPDGNDTVDALATAAAERGITEIALTDHCDCDMPPGDPWHYDFDASRKAFLDAKDTRGVTVKFGVELGQYLYNREFADAVLARGDFDFVIGSLHKLKGFPDFYCLDYRSFDMDECLRQYFDETARMCRTGSFQVLGHLTYPFRYAPAFGLSLSIEPYWSQVTDILKILIDQGMGIEVNTSALFSNLGETMPPEPVIRLYRELGGTILTIGSDAHSAARVGEGFEQVCDMLSRIGFTHFTVFDRRLPRQVPLPERAPEAKAGPNEKKYRKAGNRNG